MSLEPGSKAPDFTLLDTEGEQVVLSEQIGAQSVTIFFFPLAFSKRCTRELCSVRDNMKMYHALNTKILAISVDSFFTLHAFKKAQNLNFTLLSDFNRDVSRLYDVLYQDFLGMKDVSRSAVFLVDKEGLIRYRQVLEDSDELPDFYRLLKQIQDLQHT